MCTLVANLYVLLTWGPHMVYTGSPHIFYIFMIKCGWLGCLLPMSVFNTLYFYVNMGSLCQCKHNKWVNALICIYILCEVVFHYYYSKRSAMQGHERMLDTY